MAHSYARLPEQVPLPRERPVDAPQQQVQEPQVEQPVAAAQETEGEGFLDQVDTTPTFAGFEDERYQEHDERIQDLVAQLNLDKAGFIGASEDQAAEIPDLDPALVKSWLIQETGGGDRRSSAAWAVDPSQVNVPGDWAAPKADAQMGLEEPSRRNEGEVDQNLKAGLVWLARKGFSRSGRAPAELQGGQAFGGWQTALENYNGRGKKMRNGKRYRENYAQRILDRAADPEAHAPIQLPK